MIHESEVRKQLAALSLNKLSLEEFEEWLASRSWNVHRDSAAKAIDLVSAIHLLLSERDDQVFSNDELKRELIALIDEVSLHHVLIDANLNVSIDLPAMRITANSTPLEVLQPVFVH